MTRQDAEMLDFMRMGKSDGRINDNRGSKEEVLGSSAMSHFDNILITFARRGGAGGWVSKMAVNTESDAEDLQEMR